MVAVQVLMVSKKGSRPQVWVTTRNTMSLIKGIFLALTPLQTEQCSWGVCLPQSLKFDCSTGCSDIALRAKEAH